ncbi:hypothetical protein DPSP01_013944 [Paraphaeosphaeria sporulosa]
MSLRSTIPAPSPSVAALFDILGINIADAGETMTESLQPAKSFTASQAFLVAPSGITGLNIFSGAAASTQRVRPVTRVIPQSSTIMGDGLPTLDVPLVASIAGINTRLPIQLLPSTTRRPFVTPSGRSPGGGMTGRLGVSDGPVYTPIASLPWWDWNGPGEGGDGLPDDNDHQYWDDGDDVSDYEYDDEGDEDARNDWEINDEYVHVHGDGDESGDDYQVGVANEHGDGYEAEVGNEQDDGEEDQCECGCDWWWTDDEDSSGEGVDWEWVNEDVVSWDEEDGTCNWRPVSTPKPTPPSVSDTRADGYDTGSRVPQPESTASQNLRVEPSTGDSDSTSNHGYNAHHAAPAQESQHGKPQSWHDGSFNTGSHYDEDDPNKKWSDGALHPA